MRYPEGQIKKEYLENLQEKVKVLVKEIEEYSGHEIKNEPPANSCTPSRMEMGTSSSTLLCEDVPGELQLVDTRNNIATNSDFIIRKSLLNGSSGLPGDGIHQPKVPDFFARYQNLPCTDQNGNHIPPTIQNCRSVTSVNIL